MNLPSEIRLQRGTTNPKCECGWTVDAISHHHYHAWRHSFNKHMPVTWLHKDTEARHDCPGPYLYLLGEAAISYGLVGPKPTKWGLAVRELRAVKVYALNRFVRWLDEVT